MSVFIDIILWLDECWPFTLLVWGWPDPNGGDEAEAGDVWSPALDFENLQLVVG